MKSGHNQSIAPTRVEPQENGHGVLIHFIRSSHIFASVVREILESRVLRDSIREELTVSQFHILKLMALNGAHRIGEVAEFLGVSQPAVTKNIDKLEALGLLVRKPSKEDGRATELSLSQKGCSLVERYEEMKAARLAPVLKGFKPEEVNQFSNLLERFAVSLLKNEETQHRYCLRCNAYIEIHCPVASVRGGCPYHEARSTFPSDQHDLGRKSDEILAKTP